MSSNFIMHLEYKNQGFGELSGCTESNHARHSLSLKILGVVGGVGVAR